MCQEAKKESSKHRAPQLGAALILSAMLSACNGSGAKIDTLVAPQNTQVTQSKLPDVQTTAKVTTASVKKGPVVKAPSAQNSYASKHWTLSKADAYREVVRIENTLSPQCRRILAETGIETTILRSPTISGSLNTDNDISVGASYDFVDLERANLKEELALARCARNAASAKIAQLLVTSSQSLTRAGYLAKARHLRQSAGKFRRIKQSISNALYNGLMTQLRANLLRQYLAQVVARSSQAEGEAAKREVIDRIQRQSFERLDRDLIEAEQRIQAIESRMRSADSVKLKASVGYSRRGDDSADLTIDRDGSVTAKVTVSMRLGAVYNRRYELEDVAANARLEQLFEKDRGVLWRSEELAKANTLHLRSLKKQRANILSALASAKRNAGRSTTTFEPEMISTQIRARIDILSLQSDLVGLDATIADTDRLNRKLRFTR